MASSASASSVSVVEHPVFFDMPGLSDDPQLELDILRGLADLKHSDHSDLHFLHVGRVTESKGVPFTHALISRFPSVDALRVYYQSAIPDIALKMRPWLKEEFCVDYEVSVNEDALTLYNKENPAFYVVFIKVKPDTSETIISSVKEAFLSLTRELDYVTHFTAGENLYLRPRYKTSSHAFLIYLSSNDALPELQKEPTFLSIINDQVLPIAESYAIVAIEPFKDQ